MVNYTFDSISKIVPVSFNNDRQRCVKADFAHLIFYKIDADHWLAIDTFNDAIEIIDNETKISIFDNNVNYICFRNCITFITTS